MSDDHEIMTLPEVATMLRLSERTVYDWAQSGKLPCGKLGNAWRFKRGEIRAWVDRNLEVRRSGPDVALERVLGPERLTLRGASTKELCLHELIDLLAADGAVKDRDELAQGIFKREGLMSTGIGLGCAVPHVRLASVSHPVMAAGAYRDGVEDYESLDSLPVRAVFMIVAGVGQHEQHLRLLSTIAHRVKTENLVDLLCGAATREDAFSILTGSQREVR